MGYNEKALLELSSYLENAKSDFDENGKTDLCGILYYMFYKLDQVGIDATWLTNPLISHFTKSIEQNSKNSGIYSLITLLEKYGCSQLQASEWIGEWFNLSQRRVLQIFQVERKKHSDLPQENNDEIKGLVHQTLITTTLTLIYCQEKPLPKDNQHVIHALHKIIIDVENTSNDDTSLQKSVTLNHMLLKEIKEKNILPI